MRKSISTSDAGSLKRLKSTASTAARRSSSVVSRSGSTEWIRNGSMIVRIVNYRCEVTPASGSPSAGSYHEYA